MFIKRYSIAAFLLMALIGWYVYAYVTQDKMSIDLFGVPLPPLSTALWIVLPMFILYIASVAHISFYSLLGSFKLRKYEKDYNQIIDAIIEALLGKKERHHSFRTPRYVLLGSLVDSVNIVPNSKIEPNTENDKLNNVLKVIEDIKSGNVADLKPYSLKIDNELYIQNQRNMYKRGDVSAEDILSHSDKYSKSLSQEAFKDYVATAPISAIVKYKDYLTKDIFFDIMKRINASENSLKIDNETIISFCDSLKLNSQDYIKLATSITTMIPEQRIKLFEVLSETKDEAMDAYLFTLLDLEMLSPADAILNNSPKGEHEKLKAYRALKECNKIFDINLFI